MNTIKEDYKKILSFYKTKKVFAIILGIAILVCLAFAWQELLVLFVIGYSIRLIVKSNKEKKNSDVKKTCPHCKEEVKADATRCPHCHGKIYVWTTGNKIVAGFLSILILFIIISVSGNSNTPTENKKVGHDDIEVCVEAQMQLKNYLKSPSTAKFPSCSNFSIVKSDNETYTVSSYVDSQNGFGAMIRSDWTVKYHYLGENNVSIDSVIMDGKTLR
jgi:Zn finger protein HypA/HybF involved in hydrogenase expression